MDNYLCFVVLICRYNFNYSPLAEVIARVTFLLPVKGKSTRYLIDIDLITQNRAKTSLHNERMFLLFNELTNNQIHVCIIKRPWVDNNDDITADFNETVNVEVCHNEI